MHGWRTGVRVRPATARTTIHPVTTIPHHEHNQYGRRNSVGHEVRTPGALPHVETITDVRVVKKHEKKR